MADQSLPAKVVVAFKGEIKTNGNLWKDRVSVRLTLGRRAETRTVQGGGVDVLPAEIISRGEFEVPMTTDILEVPVTPIDPNSLSFWVREILVNGKFPVITITKASKNKVPDTGTLSFTAEVYEVVPADKEGEEAEELYVCRFIPTIYTSWIRTA